MERDTPERPPCEEELSLLARAAEGGSLIEQERIPLDGVVFEGITTIDTAAVSGQRSPWAVNVGYKVYAGCRNLTSDIKVRVSRPSEQSTASKIIRVSEKLFPLFVVYAALSAASMQHPMPFFWHFRSQGVRINAGRNDLPLESKRQIVMSFDLIHFRAD